MVAPPAGRWSTVTGSIAPARLLQKTIDSGLPARRWRTSRTTGGGKETGKDGGIRRTPSGCPRLAARPALDAKPWMPLFSSRCRPPAARRPPPAACWPARPPVARRPSSAPRPSPPAGSLPRVRVATLLLRQACAMPFISTCGCPPPGDRRQWGRPVFRRQAFSILPNLFLCFPAREAPQIPESGPGTGTSLSAMIGVAVCKRRGRET